MGAAYATTSSERPAASSPQEHTRGQRRREERPAMDHIGINDVHNKDSQIPTRKTALQVAAYAPLAAAPVLPDVMLVRGNARQLMLLAEAAQALHRQPRLHRRRRH